MKGFGFSAGDVYCATCAVLQRFNIEDLGIDGVEIDDHTWENGYENRLLVADLYA